MTYLYSDIIFNPYASEHLIGRNVFYGDTPYECLFHANHPQAVSSPIKSILHRTAKPFILEAQEQPKEGSPLMLNRTASCVILDRRYDSNGNDIGIDKGKELEREVEFLDKLHDLYETVFNDLRDKLGLSFYDGRHVDDAFMTLSLARMTLNVEATFYGMGDPDRKMPLTYRNVLSDIFTNLDNCMGSSIDGYLEDLDRFDNADPKLVDKLKYLKEIVDDVVDTVKNLEDDCLDSLLKP